PGVPAAPLTPAAPDGSPEAPPTASADPNISPAALNAAAGATPQGVPVQPVSGPYGAAPVYPTYPHYGGYGGPVPYAPAGAPPPYVVGVTAPTYGYPITGTPIGLPGPPHIPLGAPAGLQQHVMRNWTHHHLPDPTHRMAIHVKQRPGFSYPQPASRAFIRTEM